MWFRLVISTFLTFLCPFCWFGFDILLNINNIVKWVQSSDYYFQFSEDTTPPVISDCPVGVVRVVELGTPGAVASWTEPTATDLSGAVTLTQRSHQPNDFFGIGATVVSYTFLDNSGNDASCSFTVNIVMRKSTDPRTEFNSAGFILY